MFSNSFFTIWYYLKLKLLIYIPINVDFVVDFKQI